jgi:molybdopterin molybdotransferase
MKGADVPTFEEARRIICDSVAPLGVERVPLLDAQGRIIAEEIVSPWDMPLCDNSAMDGFAVRAADCSTIPVTLRVTGYIPAGGTVSGAVAPGSAVRIMTGAPIPPECDAVIPFEDTDDQGDRVTVRKPVSLRQHIRFAGEDVTAGETIISPGTVIRPAEISMLASAGRALVPVFRSPRVAILSTGDELVELGEPLLPGRVINSNILSLAAAVKELGAEPVLLGIAHDDRESHVTKMTEGLKADALITSAGVSAGDRDLVRDVLAELGVRQLFWKVKIRPGGPTAFGMKGATPVFSLPGNPVSTLVTFEEFVRPALLKMMGFRRIIRQALPATLMNDVRKKPGNVLFLRVRIEIGEEGYRAYTSGTQHTGLLKTMLRADAIAILPEASSEVKAGETVRIHLLRDDLLLRELPECPGNL